jgi:hypothetical protein
MKGLYPGPLFRSVDWILADLDGGAAGTRGVVARRAAGRRLSGMDAEARWREVTVHLGELLVALTERLPQRGVAQTAHLLGKICFDFGVWVAGLIKRLCRMPDVPDSAIEVLRMGEYLFRVNPEHHSASDAAARTGHIVGNACPWFPRPGWGGMHCGIFGRFQDGCANVFGLSYRLTTTIPRHGGDVCRIDLRPIKLRRREPLDAHPAR